MEYKLFQEGKKSSMTLERIQKLESIGFVWAKRKGPEAWETKFRELVLYKEEHGGEIDTFCFGDLFSCLIYYQQHLSSLWGLNIIMISDCLVPTKYTRNKALGRW